MHLLNEFINYTFLNFRMEQHTSEMESDTEDPEKLLNAWLGELDSLTMVSLTIKFKIYLFIAKFIKLDYLAVGVELEAAELQVNSSFMAMFFLLNTKDLAFFLVNNTERPCLIIYILSTYDREIMRENTRY